MEESTSNSNVAIKVPTNGNKLLEQALEVINKDVEIATLWRVINVNATERLGWSDHGPVHFKIVANVALRLIRMLSAAKVEMAVVRDYGLTAEHAELVVLLGSLFHDLGMTINREGHEEFSLIVASGILPKVLHFLPVEEQVIIRSEALHAIISHRSDGRPLTTEAGIVRIADALDMSEGRSRLVFNKGKIDIHTLSAFAIDKVEIGEGKETPVEITVTMNNSAGIFQVDELLKEKLHGSGLEKYFTVRAFVAGETEKKLVTEFRL